MARTRLYRLRKTQLCGQTRIGAHILGNTIGNAIAGGISQASNTAAQGPQVPAAPGDGGETTGPTNLLLGTPFADRTLTDGETRSALTNVTPVTYQTVMIQPSDTRSIDNFIIDTTVPIQIGAVNGASTDAVVNSLQQLSQAQLQYVHDQGVQFAAVQNSVVEYAPELVGVLTRGATMDNPRTWDETGGTFDSITNTVVIATNPGSPDATSVSADVVLHELGHAIDYRMSLQNHNQYASSSESFKSAYYSAEESTPWDPANLNDSYYLKSSNPGYLSETFAESFAATFTKGGGNFGNNDPNFNVGRPSLPAYWNGVQWKK